MKAVTQPLAGLLVAIFLTLNASSQVPASQTLRGHIPAGAVRARHIGPLATTNTLDLAIGLPLRNTGELKNLLRNIYDPASPDFHHYLTPAEFAERFGPSEKDYRAMIRFAEANGFTVTAQHPNRMLLDVRGPVAVINRALHVTMGSYRHPLENRIFFAPDVDPSLNVSVPVIHIGGLDNYSLPRPRMTAKPLSAATRASPAGGSGPDGTLLGSDFRGAYVPGTSMTGAGQVVGLLQFDGYDSNDIVYYENLAGLPAVSLTNILIDGFNGNPSGGNGEVEVCLDIEMAMAMAPGLSKIIVYEAPNPSPFEDILNRMANDNLAKQLSCSWFIPNGASNAVADQIFQQMAVQGQSFFAASGDSDAYTGLISFPSDSPYITVVGGTTLTTTGTNFTSETVWNWGSGVGSGGGISTQYPIPSWQTNLSMAANQGSTVKRNVPDVALTADNIYVRAQGLDYSEGGTSAASPLWAGFMALVNQQAVAISNAPAGFINPAVYAIGRGTGYATAFHDVTTGNNESPASPTKFLAATGYDLCTGWGTPRPALIGVLASNSIVTNSAPAILVQPISRSVPVGTNVTFNVVATGSSPLSYRWTFNGTNIDSATNSSLTLVGVQLSQSGYYAVAITNLYGSATSSNALLTVYPLSSCYPVSGGIVGWWSAEQNTDDFTGVNNGITEGGAGFASGEIGQAFFFHQTNADVKIPASSSLDVGTGAGFTLEAWVKCTNVANLNPLFEWNLADGHTQWGVHFYVGAGGPGCLYANVVDSGGAWHAFQSAGVISNNTFYHVALTYDRTSGVAIMYANGTNVAQTTAGSFTPQTSYPLFLGRRPGPETVYNLVGLLDEATVYDRALSSNEVAAIYQAGTAGKCGPLIPPTISVQPTDVIVAVGNTATFSVFATGTTPLSYQWRFNGTNINNATSNVLALSNAQLAMAGNYTVLVTNVVGSTVSSNAILIVGDAPLITTQPVNTTNLVGTTATFLVQAAGTAPLAYQWKTNGVNINGATATNLVIAGVQTNHAGVYSVVVTNLFGSVVSSNANLVVLAPPLIIVQPTNRNVNLNGIATFSVVAAGTTPLAYRWTFGGTNIAGATNASLTLNNVQFNQAGNYAVIVTNLYGSATSSNAVLTVIVPPPCNSAPSNIVAWWAAEGSAADSVGTNHGVLLGGVSFTNGKAGQAFLFNTTNARVMIPASPGLNVGNSNGFTIEGWINPGGPMTGQAYPIAEWNSTVSLGTHFYANVTGAGNLYANIIQVGGPGHVIQSAPGVVATNVFQHVALTYDKVSGIARMYCNGAMVLQQAIGSFTPQTSYSLWLGARPTTVTNVTSLEFPGMIDELAVYSRALASNEIAAIYLADVSGKCPLPPTILTQPANQTVSIGGTANFSVVATGTPLLTYQWVFNGTNIAGATNVSLTVTNAQLPQAGIYAVQVANNIGLVSSSNALLTIPVPPAITVQPTNQTVLRGDTVIFGVGATGSSPLSYQWRFNGTNVAGATNTALGLVNVQLNQAGTYLVLVTNLYGSVLSSNAILTVNPLFHFVWNAIPTNRFVNVPFTVTVTAKNPTNGLATNFVGTVTLLTTNGLPINPASSGTFVQGVWTGTVAVAQTGTNIVLEAVDAFNETGFANPIRMVNVPATSVTLSGGTFYISWPIDPASFVLETTPSLSPTTWISYPGSPIQVGNQYLQPVTVTTSNAFFRLRYTGQ